jgi:hypothetical protein
MIPIRRAPINTQADAYLRVDGDLAVAQDVVLVRRAQHERVAEADELREGAGVRHRGR